MPTNNTSSNDSAPTNDQNAILQAIESFEGILEAFPEDVSALESLIVAYEEAGATDKIIAKSLQLADLMAQEGNWRRVENITQNILAKDGANNRARILLDTARDSLQMETSEATAEKPAAPPEPAKTTSQLSFDINAELELAWFLLNNDIITQDHYEAAISGLTNSRTNSHSTASLSLLQELANIERLNLDRIIGALSARTETPYIDVTQFEIDPETGRLIPLEDARKLGILAFGRLKNDVMVAVLNPVSESLRKKVTAFLQVETHFFLTGPEQLHNAIDKLAGVKK